MRANKKHLNFRKEGVGGEGRGGVGVSDFPQREKEKEREEGRRIELLNTG